MELSVSDEAVSVLVHPTQFPQAIEAALCESLRMRRMNHKFHYDTPKQTVRWLRLHEAFSPARKDPSCLAAYEKAFAAVAENLSEADTVEIVSLGCGGGQKEAQLIQTIQRFHSKIKLRFVPVDVSAGLALTSREAAINVGVPSTQCFPFVMDLALADDWKKALAPVLDEKARRIITFFGMMPNFTSGSVLPQLAALLRPDDLLLVSANLAPGTDYAKGVEQILPLYENILTRKWLLSVLLDLGVERADGKLEFQICHCPENSGLLRIQSDFVFERKCVISFAGKEWNFQPGERFQLFFSYRHTPEKMKELFEGSGMKIERDWTNDAGDEGVFKIQTSRS